MLDVLVLTDASLPSVAAVLFSLLQRASNFGHKSVDDDDDDEEEEEDDSNVPSFSPPPPLPPTES